MRVARALTLRWMRTSGWRGAARSSGSAEPDDVGEADRIRIADRGDRVRHETGVCQELGAKQVVQDRPARSDGGGVRGGEHLFEQASPGA